MSKRLLARGIFAWDAPERRTQRYGYFYAGDKTFDKDVALEPVFNSEYAIPLQGKRVKVTVKVLQARQSGHAGDLYLDILPSTPEVGEEVVLGVGTLDVRPNPHTPGVYDLGLIPNDVRSLYWIDPHGFYRLHDQTVEIYAEQTDEPHHPAPDIKPVREAGKAISNGDGTIQVVGLDWPEGKKANIKPKIERLGGGLFKLERPNSEGNRGDTFDIEIEQ